MAGKVNKMKMKNLHIRIPDDELELIKKVAKQEYMNVSQLVRKLVITNINK